MPTYITLGKWTEQGIKNVKDSPDRLEKARDTYARLGGTIREFYMVLGEYDFVAIGEAPDDDAAARFALAYGRTGNGRTETLRAFTEAEYRQIVDTLP